MWLDQLEGTGGFKKEQIEIKQILFYVNSDPELNLIEKDMLNNAIIGIIEHKKHVNDAAQMAELLLRHGPGQMKIIYLRKCHNCNLVTANKTLIKNPCNRNKPHYFTRIGGNTLCTWCGNNWKGNYQCIDKHVWSQTHYRTVASTIDDNVMFSTSDNIPENISFDEIKQFSTSCTLCSTEVIIHG